MEEELISVFVNPLQMLELDEPWTDHLDGALTPDVFLRFLCAPGVASDPKSLGTRYKQISVERVRLFAPPDEATIMERLVWPLRHAKAAYVVGNYLATIALAGVVAEMTALLLWDVFGSARLEHSAKVSKELGRSTFEMADQARRVKALRAADLISTDEQHAYSRIRVGRRSHMHLWTLPAAPIEKTAVEVFDDAVFLVSRGLGLGFKEGGLMSIKQEILDYVKTRQG